MKAQTKVITSREYPEKEVNSLKLGEHLIWVHPDYVRRHGPFHYRGEVIGGKTVSMNSLDLPVFMLGAHG